MSETGMTPDGAITHNDDDAPSRNHAPVIIAIVLILAAFGYLLYGNISKNLTWNLTPNELLAKGPSAYDHAVRLGGLVVPGSVQWDSDKSGVAFQVRDTVGPVINVHSKGTPTAMFREGIGVVVEGKYERTNAGAMFNATNLMVKHSNEYKPPAGMVKSKKDEMFNTLIKS
jgi:cytochrome c-type biogenesis protein CcmE